MGMAGRSKGELLRLAKGGRGSQLGKEETTIASKTTTSGAGGDDDALGAGAHDGRELRRQV